MTERFLKRAGDEPVASKDLLATATHMEIYDPYNQCGSGVNVSWWTVLSKKRDAFDEGWIIGINGSSVDIRDQDVDLGENNVISVKLRSGHETTMKLEVRRELTLSLFKQLQEGKQ